MFAIRFVVACAMACTALVSSSPAGAQPVTVVNTRAWLWEAANGVRSRSDGTLVPGATLFVWGDSNSAETWPGYNAALAQQLGLTRINGWATAGGQPHSLLKAVGPAWTPVRQQWGSDWVANAWRWNSFTTPGVWEPVADGSLGPNSVNRVTFTGDDAPDQTLGRFYADRGWASFSMPQGSAWLNGPLRLSLVVWATPSGVRAPVLRGLRLEAGVVAPTKVIDCSSKIPGYRVFDMDIPAGFGTPAIDVLTGDEDETGREFIIVGCILTTADAAGPGNPQGSPATRAVWHNRGGSSIRLLLNPVFLPKERFFDWLDIFGKPSLFTLQLGTNDENLNNGPLEGFEQRAQDLQDRLLEYGDSRGFRSRILWITPWHTANNSVEWLTRVGNTYRRLAQIDQSRWNGRVGYVDLFLRTGTYPGVGVYLADGVHPNATGGAYFSSMLRQAMGEEGVTKRPAGAGVEAE